MPDDPQPRKLRSLKDLGLASDAAHAASANAGAQPALVTSTLTPEFFAELARRDKERRLNDGAELHRQTRQRMYDDASRERARQEEHLSLQRRTAAAAEGALVEARAREAEMEGRALKAEAEAAKSARQARIANLFACGSLAFTVITYFLTR